VDGADRLVVVAARAGERVGHARYDEAIAWHTELGQAAA
jgi:hypothetical protein